MGHRVPEHFKRAPAPERLQPGVGRRTLAQPECRSVYPTFARRWGNVRLVINCRPKVLRTQNLLRMAPTAAPTRVYCFIGSFLMWPCSLHCLRRFQRCRGIPKCSQIASALNCPTESKFWLLRESSSGFPLIAWKKKFKRSGKIIQVRRVCMGCVTDLCGLMQSSPYSAIPPNMLREAKHMVITQAYSCCFWGLEINNGYERSTGHSR